MVHDFYTLFSDKKANTMSLNTHKNEGIYLAQYLLNQKKITILHIHISPLLLLHNLQTHISCLFVLQANVINYVITFAFVPFIKRSIFISGHNLSTIRTRTCKIINIMYVTLLTIIYNLNSIKQLQIKQK